MNQAEQLVISGSLTVSHTDNDEFLCVTKQENQSMQIRPQLVSKVTSIWHGKKTDQRLFGLLCALWKQPDEVAYHPFHLLR